MDSLEAVLDHMIREFSYERRQLLGHCDAIHDESRQEIQGLQKAVEAKTRECAHIRKLARKILLERNDIERFFLESLEHVKQQILHNQLVFSLKYYFVSGIIFVLL